MTYESKKMHSKMLAVTLVAILALCSVSVMFTETDAADNNGETFTINMFTGENFTYNPQVNISSNVAIDDTMNDTNEQLTFNGTTLSGSFTTAGDYNVVLTATWSSNGLSQTATQTIKFHVENAPAFTTPTTDYYVLITAAASTDIATITWNDSTVKGTVSVGTITHNGSGAASDISAVPGESNVVISVADALDEGEYTIPLTLTRASGTGSGSDTSTGQRVDTAQMTVKVHVAEEFQISGSPSSPVYTFQGGNGNNPDEIEVTFDSNRDDIVSNDPSVSEVTWTLQTESGSYITQDETNKNVIKINTTSFTGNFGDADFIPITFTMTGAVTTSAGQVTDDETYTINVYRNLLFTSSPVIGVPTATSSTNNDLSMLLTANFSGANRVEYNWGDGETTSVDLSGNNPSATYSIDHTYARAGTYMITVTAYNDVGKDTSIIMYSADDAMDVGDGTVPGTDDGTQGGNDDGNADSGSEDGFFDEHGWIFLVFVILTIAFVIAYFGFGIQHPLVIVAAVICVILAALMYVYADFGGLFDAIGGLF